jgi:CheY-like chemotaxis protein
MAVPSPKEILVVEDDLALRDALRDTFEDEGYRARTAANGSEALSMLMTGRPPDLILLDLLMPMMNGWGLMAELKARPALAAIPVIATTGAGTKILNTAPVCAGYITKPIDRARLLETVARILSRPPSSAPGGGAAP